MEKEQVNKLVQYGTFNGEPLNGKLIETHISWVILTRKYAFKIKKPMRYSFLDFSTLSKRKFYCERELILNRRITTSIYLDVLPIEQHNNRLYIGQGGGKVIDYAVRMKKMQAGKKMDSMLYNNKVVNSHVKILAEKIAAFHKRTDVVNKPFNKARSKKAFNDISRVAGWIKKHLGKSYADIVEKAVSHSNAFLDQASPLITKRIKNGFQRDVHGDLHSRNIFLYKEPVIFDCIEFNDDLRQIDVLNEVAFFCMDLEAFQQWNLSKRFMEQYLELFPCMSGLKEKQLFAYYKGYRANVRAKVNAMRAIQTIDEAEVRKYNCEVKKYLELLDYYLST